MMLKAIDKGLLRVAVCVSASLMFGVMLAVWLRMLDAVAGRTSYSLAAGAGLVAAGLRKTGLESTRKALQAAPGPAPSGNQSAGSSQVRQAARIPAQTALAER